MERCVRSLQLAAVLAFALVATAAPIQARDDVRSGGPLVVQRTGRDGLDVRAGPGSGFPTVGVLAEGTRVEILGGPRPRDTEDWYWVEWAAPRGVRLRGWVDGSYLRAGPPADVHRPPVRTLAVEVRAYTTGGEVGTVTATGTTVRWGTVAVDPSTIPLGSLLLIDGFDGLFVAEDVGPAIRGAVIDVWFPDRDAALDWGHRQRRITILREGY